MKLIIKVTFSSQRFEDNKLKFSDSPLFRKMSRLSFNFPVDAQHCTDFPVLHIAQVFSTLKHILGLIMALLVSQTHKSHHPQSCTALIATQCIPSHK